MRLATEVPDRQTTKQAYDNVYGLRVKWFVTTYIDYNFQHQSSVYFSHTAVRDTGVHPLQTRFNG